jgi:hypothetical protein
MKKLITLLSIPLLALTLNGCRDLTNDFSKHKEKDGLMLKAWADGMGNSVRIEENGSLENLYKPHILARDIYPCSKDSIGDGRIDEINLYNIPKGHKLEKYVNLDSLNKLYNEVKETGEDLK